MSDLNVYTTSQINALTPITGDMVVDSDLNAVKLYDGAAWRVFNDDRVIVYDKAITLDGSSVLNLGNIAAMNSATDFSISLWFKEEANLGSHGMIFSSGEWQPVAFYLQAYGSQFYLGYGSNQYRYASYTHDTDWHHVVYTHSPSAINLYIDGNIQTLNSSGITPYTTPSTMGDDAMIADMDGSSGYPDTYNLQGKVDEFAVFSSALTQANVTALAASRTNHIVNDLALSPSPVNYWRMGEDDAGLADGDSVAQISSALTGGSAATQADLTKQPVAYSVAN